MLEMIPFVGSHTDVIAPDLGTNEQIMAWFMAIYSMYQVQTVAEIVTGKPVSAGGTLGRREATGRGMAHLVRRAADELKIPLNGPNSRLFKALEISVDHRTRATQHGSESDRGQRSHGRRFIGVGGSIYHSWSDMLPRNVAWMGYSSELALDPGELLTIPCDCLFRLPWNGSSTPIPEGHQEEIFLIPMAIGVERSRSKRNTRTVSLVV